MSKTTKSTELTPTMVGIIKKMKRGARLVITLDNKGKGFLQSVAKRKHDPIPATTVKALIDRQLVTYKTKSKEYKIYGV